LIIGGGINPAAADSVSIGGVPATERTAPAVVPPQDAAALPTGQHLPCRLRLFQPARPAIARWPKRRRAGQVFPGKSPTP
jgi:hypothetical protein